MTEQSTATSKLPDLPNAAFEAVLRYMASQDHGNLRQTNSCLSKRVTQHVPYITLLLSDSSNAAKLRQWDQYTRQFQRVSNIHIHISGEVPTGVFEAAMQKLSKRPTRIKELHVLSVNFDTSSSSSSSNSNANAQVPSLLPLRHVLADLHTLVIDRVAVKNMPDDLRDLAGAAPDDCWQLQLLTLKGPWTYPNKQLMWPALPRALWPLTIAFPDLKQLTFQHPSVMFYPRLEEHSKLAPKVFEHPQLAEVAAVAAVANAVVKLESLEILELTDMPDLWGNVYSISRQSAIEAARADGAEKDEVIKAVLYEGLLPSLTAAAAALPTLEAFGGWLLQQHETLSKLHIRTANAPWPACVRPWAMSWHKQQHNAPADAPAAAAAAASSQQPVLISVESSCMKKQLELAKLILDNRDATSRGSEFRKKSLLKRCSRYLAAYSSCPLSELLSHITSFKIDVFHLDVHTLGKLLRGMKALRHLEITVSRHDVGVGDFHPDTPSQITPTTAAATQVLTAVAAVTALEFLNVTLEVGGRNLLPDDLLLQLTAAAGGPGSSLRKLQLLADIPATESNMRHLPHRDQDRNIRLNCSCFQSLSKLDGLMELDIYCTKDRSKLLVEHCCFALELLPKGLQVLTAGKLNISSNMQTSASSSSISSSGAGAQNATSHLLLRHLCLDHCILSSPSILAGSRLQELAVGNSSWTGGWAAAAAAWPNVRKLVWQDDFESADGTGVELNDLQLLLAEMGLEEMRPAVAKAYRALQDMLTGFRHLKSLLVLGLPSAMMSSEVLQPLVSHMQHLKHVHIYCKSGNGDHGLQIAQQWLQQELPWASVHITMMPANLNEGIDDLDF